MIGDYKTGIRYDVDNNCFNINLDRSLVCTDKGWQLNYEIQQMSNEYKEMRYNMYSYTKDYFDSLFFLSRESKLFQPLKKEHYESIHASLELPRNWLINLPPDRPEDMSKEDWDAVMLTIAEDETTWLESSVPHYTRPIPVYSTDDYDIEKNEGSQYDNDKDWGWGDDTKRHNIPNNLPDEW
eukprot:TRINITY_DN7032_c0_g1_i2.p1 TRINITY_DN7032_c0_g1~~TRINITY_DN7032_c0_g1_i2.p1  ORF type:complete len:182 (-),score=33.85 TRINITY_DN7032_c0_g1_i2:684-1229(-)